MAIRLVDSAWNAELTDALRADTSALRIICPFIGATGWERLQLAFDDLGKFPKNSLDKLDWPALP